MIIFMSVIAILGVFLDIVIVSHFWLGFKSDTMLIIIAHLQAAILVFFSLTIILKSLYRKIPVPYLFLLFSLCMLIPLLGLLISCVLVFLKIKFHQIPTEQLIQHIAPNYEGESLSSLYGIGGVRAQLQSPKFSLSKKTAALFAMGNKEVHVTNTILQETLHDKQEELRLLAFGLLEYQGKDIHNHISAATEILEAAPTFLERAYLKKQIAQLHWELVYRGLNPDMEDLILEHAQNYTEDALTVLTDNAALWILCGKIYHRLNNHEKAKEMFKKAENFGASPENFIFYLAEAAYRQRDFKAVKDYFKNAKILCDIPITGSVARFWGEKYDLS